MKNIYVGNLDFRTTEAELRGAFEAYGRVEKITLVRDRETDQPRGFAFVEMTNDGEAQQAITKLNGAPLGSRALAVNEARPKVKRDGGRFGARGARGSRW